MHVVPTTVPRVLPLPLASWVGRVQELAEVAGQIRQADLHLLTLTGPGGVGKTRLAIRAANEVATEFADGVWFVPLAPVADPALVVPTIALTLGVREAADGEAPAAPLTAWLGDKALLLVLDNFEQVVDAAPAVTALLAACPRLKIVVTSRVRLRVTGECEYPVPPLSLPSRGVGESGGRGVRSVLLGTPSGHPTRPAGTRHVQRAPDSDSDAVRLFVERARAIRPDFALSDQTAPVVADICRRLDGLPLAIELAAARTKVLSPPALLARLGRSLPLLAGGGRDLPARQQTLRDAIAGSYDLLSPEEQTLFRRLGVFVGGFTIEAAEAVSRGVEESSSREEAPILLDTPRGHPTSRLLDFDVLDGLGSLVDKSLVQRGDEADGEARLGLLETVREFALERLEASGEAETVRRAHAAYFLDLAEQVEARYLSVEEAVWLDRAEPELDNLRAALTWAATAGQADADFGLRLAAALWRFWQTRGHVREGRTWLEETLARDAGLPTQARAKALSVVGNLAWIQKDERAAAAFHDESIAIWRALDDTSGTVRGLFLRGLVAQHEDDLAAMAALAEEGLTLLPDCDNLVWCGATLVNAGVLAQRRGELDRAAAVLAEALERYEALGFTWGVAWIRGHLGRVARDLGDRREATAQARQSLTVYRDHRDMWGVVEQMSDLATLAAEAGRAEQAARLFGAVEALREAIGIPITPADQQAHEQIVTGVRSALSASAFSAAWAAGRALSPREAVAEALADQPVPTPEPSAPATANRADAASLAGLSLREDEVLRLLGHGKTNAEIAELLFISPRTAGTHVANILAKLGVGSRAAAVAVAHQRGLV